MFRETSGLSKKQNKLFPLGPYIKFIIVDITPKDQTQKLKVTASRVMTSSEGRNLKNVFAISILFFATF